MQQEPAADLGALVTEQLISAMEERPRRGPPVTKSLLPCDRDYE